jgi:pimeloyl-ACP methyl ester carboxylesterase
VEFSIGRFTADVRAYLDRPHIRKAVHDIVAPAITAGPCVVVAHSLGTIVAYRLLVELIAAPSVKLLITAGSPLGIATIKDKLPPRGQVLRFPPGVEHWLNVADQRDYVALEASLDRKTFLDGVENILDIDNGDEPHSIERYLADITVARRIARALGLV